MFVNVHLDLLFYIQIETRLLLFKKKLIEEKRCRSFVVGKYLQVPPFSRLLLAVNEPSWTPAVALWVVEQAFL